MIDHQLSSLSKALMNGEKTGIDHIHTAISEQLHWLLFTFEEQFEERYNTMATQKELCQGSQEEMLAE